MKKMTRPMPTSLTRAGCLAAALLAPGTVQAQAKGLDRVQWLVGCWERQQPSNRRTIELWEPPRAGVMAGGSFAVTDTSTRENEQIRLWAAGDTLIYEAHPSTQARTQFRAAPAGDEEFVFANPAHDFPQRIVYRRVGSDSLIARIEGDRAGRRPPVTFAFRRAPCGALRVSPAAHARAVLQAKYDSLSVLQMATPGTRFGWFADQAGSGYTFTVWSSPGSTVQTFDAASLRQFSAQSVASFRAMRPANVRHEVTVERVRATGDSVFDALLSSRFVYSVVDSAGRMGPAGQSHERGTALRWLDTWSRSGGELRLRRTEVISEDVSMDGRLIIRDGRSVPTPP